MKRLIWSTLLFMTMFAAQAVLAGALPLTFHAAEGPAPPLMRIESYEMQRGDDQELRIRLNAEDAKALQKLTAQHLGKKLIVKEGERVLATPTVKAVLTGQDFVVSLKK